MKINIPTTCPCCDYPLELVNEQLFCRNTACPAQLGKKIEHFAKVLGIKGLGPKTVEKLNLSEVIELFSLNIADAEAAIGSKMAEKLIAEIEKAKSASLEVVLAAFSIPLIGNTASTKICKVVKHVDDITVEACKLAGLGDKATSNLIEWLNTEFKEMREFLPFRFSTDNKSAESNNNGLVICITGKLASFKTKAEATKILEELGYRIVPSLTRAVNILVDEENRGSDKRKKAEAAGIQIVTNLQQFINNN
jgi:DNA ligase (NAD+)